MRQSPHASGKTLNLRAQVVKTLLAVKMVNHWPLC